MDYKRSLDSKREVPFKTSIFRFSLVFILVLAAGVISNLYISKIDLQSRLPQEFMESKDYQLSVDNLEVRFKKGIFPIIGLFSKRIEWKDSHCPTRRVVAQDIFLVLDFFSLIQGKVKPGRIDVEFAEATTPDYCENSKGKESSINKQVLSSLDKMTKDLTADGVRKSSQERGPKAIFDFVKKMRALNFFPTVNVHKFKLSFFKGYKEELVAEGQLFLKRKKEFQLQVLLSDLFFKGYELPLKEAVVDLSVNEERALFEIHSTVREGLLKLKAQVDNNTYNSTVSLDVVKLPLSPFSMMLFKKIQVSYLWLDCKASVSGPWNEVRDIEFSFESCGLNGPYGASSVIQSKLNLKKIKELSVEFNKFDIDKILKSKREAYLSGIFSSYGQFSSVFNMKNGIWDAKGLFQKSELIFSRNNLRDIQKINKLPFEIEGKVKDWQLSIQDVELEEGVFNGLIEIHFKNGLSKAKGRAEIHQLLLRPDIYKLMVLSQPVPLSFFGKVEIKDKKINDWSGIVTAKNLRGDKYKFSAVKIEGKRIVDGISEFKFYIPKGEISKDSQLINWVHPTTLTQSWSIDQYKFKEFSVRVNLLKDRALNWKRGYLKFSNGWQLSSEGHLVSDQKKLDLWIQWDKPNRHYLKWDFKAHFLKPGWIPKTQWTKDWLEKNPDFVKDNTSIQFSGVEPKKLTEELNDMSKKTIEKVKDVLSIKSKDKKKGS